MKNLIEVQNISKEYKNGKKRLLALEDLSLVIEKRDIYGIIGLSGAGKSTLIRAIAGLVKPSTGKILFHGKEMEGMSPEERSRFHRKIGMIFQHFNLLSSRTVFKNVAYPLEIAGLSESEQRKRIDPLLKLTGLEHKAGAFPAQLSGGEKQRVGIARALANDPELLLCDEATSSLDPKTTQEILALLKNVNQQYGVTIVLITHEMEVIKQCCNKVAVIEGGKIIEGGEVSEVFADPKEAITKALLQTTTHEIPAEFFKMHSAHRKLLRLSFKGKVTADPIVSEMVRRFDVDVNILFGWIDRIQNKMIGNLTIELLGEPQGISSALSYLQERAVDYQEVYE